MSVQNQVQAVQRQIEDNLRKVSDTEASLALEKQAGDKEEVKHLRGRLEQLDKIRVCLHEEENLLLRALQGGDLLSILSLACDLYTLVLMPRMLPCLRFLTLRTMQ